MSLFRGCGAAMITPFRADGEVDFSAFEQMLLRQIKEGTDAIIVCGTTGEPSTMTDKEREACISFAVETVAHRIPVIAGTGGNCTKVAAEQSKMAERLGADGLLVVTPYYNKATQEGLFQHYQTVAGAVTLPVIMYNVPSRTGVNLLPETAVRIAKNVDNIIAIKEAGASIAQTAKLAALGEGVLDLYSGNDDQIIPILSLGGIGVISVLANVAPKAVHDMTVEYLEGDRERARILQLSCLPLIEQLFSEVNPIPVKAALHHLGLCENVLRLPLTPMGVEKERMLVCELERLKHLGLVSCFVNGGESCA